MSLKVTIKDAAGNPTTLDVHEMHITSNDSANSIHLAPTGPATTPHVFQQQQYAAPLQNFGSQLYNNFAPVNAPPLLFDKADDVTPNFGNSQYQQPNSSPITAPVYKQVIEKAPSITKSTGEQMSGGHTGGSKKRRNKRIKRTRKQRRSRKRSTKR
jgi:hypothetical protein